MENKNYFECPMCSCTEDLIIQIQDNLLWGFCPNCSNSFSGSTLEELYTLVQKSAEDMHNYKEKYPYLWD